MSPNRSPIISSPSVLKACVIHVNITSAGEILVTAKMSYEITVMQRYCRPSVTSTRAGIYEEMKSVDTFMQSYKMLNERVIFVHAFAKTSIFGGFTYIAVLVQRAQYHSK
jgi:hypothetical protein